MKALTVQQPWAWAIIHGGKDVENRTQAWSYRGPLAIHAGQRWSERGAEHPRYLLTHAMSIAAVRHRVDLKGAILGTVDLVDVHIAEPETLGDNGIGTPACCDSPWAETSYAEHGGRTRRDIVHLVLEHPRPLAEPIPCRGALGLWTPSADVLARIELNLGAAEWIDEIKAADR